MYLTAWDDFATAALDLFQADPTAVRCLTKYRVADGAVVFKVTDDRVCLQYRTSEVQDLKRFEKLSRKLSRILAGLGPEDDAAEEAAAAAPVEPTSPKAATSKRGRKGK